MKIRLSCSDVIYVVLELPGNGLDRTRVHGLYNRKAHAVKRAERLKTGKTEFGTVGYIAVLKQKVKDETSLPIVLSFRSQETLRNLTDAL